MVKFGKIIINNTNTIFFSFFKRHLDFLNHHKLFPVMRFYKLDTYFQSMHMYVFMIINMHSSVQLSRAAHL